MVFVDTIGTPQAVMGTSVLSDNAQASLWPSIFQQPRIIVTINGTVLQHVLRAHITYGLDIGVAQATVELTEVPIINDYSKFSNVQIFCDAGNSGAPASPPLRFTGLYLRTEATLNPHVFKLVCAGMLYLAQQYKQASFINAYPYTDNTVIAPTFVRQFGIPVGMYPWQNLAFLSNLPPSVDTTKFNFVLDSATAPTDQQYILAVLSMVPNLVVEPADIGGTGKLFGVLGYLDLVWPPYRSALEQIQLLDQVCLGYRLFESLAGRIVRSQIFGYPSSVSDTSFTEGIDIWAGQGSRSVEHLINGVLVEGNASPVINEGMIFDYVQQSNPFQPATNPVVEQFQSSLIETSSILIAGGQNVNALSTYDVALWRLAEGNRELVNYTLTTFRDDLLFPGRSIALNAPHMDITEPVWMQHVDITIDSDPVLFEQTITGLGGGIAGFGPGAADYMPPLSPNNGFQ
jgi:hypothetical protein